MNSVGIIGLGRFGQLLANMLATDYTIKAYDINPTDTTAQLEYCTLQEVLQEHIIFIAVPIRQFESTIKDISPLLLSETNGNQTIIDVCSVKVHPNTIMTHYLPQHVDIIATHPMFGPDSYLSKKNINIMMHQTRDQYQRYDFWKNYFSSKHINVVEMTPDEHDQFAAQSQGITHFLGRILDAAQVKSTPIDTPGFTALLELIQQTCNDSWELFYDLQTYNPYSKEMIDHFVDAFQTIRSKLNTAC